MCFWSRVFISYVLRLCFVLVVGWCCRDLLVLTLRFGGGWVVIFCSVVVVYKYYVVLIPW